MKKIVFLLKQLITSKYLSAYWVYTEDFIKITEEEESFDYEEIITKKELLPIGFNKAIILSGILKGEVIELNHRCWMRVEGRMAPITFKNGRVTYV